MGELPQSLSRGAIWIVQIRRERFEGWGCHMLQTLNTAKISKITFKFCKIFPGNTPFSCIAQSLIIGLPTLGSSLQRLPGIKVCKAQNNGTHIPPKRLQASPHLQERFYEFIYLQNVFKHPHTSKYVSMNSYTSERLQASQHLQERFYEFIYMQNASKHPNSSKNVSMSFHT